MADVPINATNIVISADIGGTGTFKVVACGTSNDLTGNLSDIDYSSKCGNLYGPGSKFDQTVTFEGMAMDQTGGTSKDNYTAIYDAYVAKTKFNIRFGVANPGSTDHYFYGEVYIDDFAVQAPYNDSLKFTCKFKITVPPLALYTGY